MLPLLALAPGRRGPRTRYVRQPRQQDGLLAQPGAARGWCSATNRPRPRLANLRRNLAAPNLLQAVTCSWPGESLPLPDASWDAVLLDPPCSGWGPRTRTRRRSSAGRATASNPCWICSASS